MITTVNGSLIQIEADSPGSYRCYGGVKGNLIGTVHKDGGKWSTEHKEGFNTRTDAVQYLIDNMPER